LLSYSGAGEMGRGSRPEIGVDFLGSRLSGRAETQKLANGVAMPSLLNGARKPRLNQRYWAFAGSPKKRG
jgi:hypothetical protein